jgi:hypothetical protein
LHHNVLIDAFSKTGMPAKVAGIFAGSQSRPKPPTLSKPALPSASDDTVFESLLRSRIDVADDIPRPKYILAAAEKAAERKALADVLKAKRIERELERLERKEGPFIRFDTVTNVGTFVEETDVVTKSHERVEKMVEEVLDIEGMRERYFERLAAKDILKPKLTEAQMKLIVNWVELSRETPS